MASSRVVLVDDDRFEPAQRGALGLQAFTAGGGRRPLLGVAGQAALDLGVALGQDAPALGDAGDLHLERLAASDDLGAPDLQVAPGVEGLGQVGQRAARAWPAPP